MRRALKSCLVAAALYATASGAPRNSWDRIRYEGGTLHVKVSPFDWNTTVTVNDDSVVFSFTAATVFKPAATLRLKPSQILSLVEGPLAIRRVSEVPGATVPAKPPRLFGILSDWASIAIIYQADDGKRGAILLNTPYGALILDALKKVTGKTPEAGR